METVMQPRVRCRLASGCRARSRAGITATGTRRNVCAPSHSGYVSLDVMTAMHHFLLPTFRLIPLLPTFWLLPFA
eukprot:6180559-Pleurochrysis_carterae.AAC.2